MSDLTRDEVLAAVHPIDDATIAEIIATGVTHDELVHRFHETNHMLAMQESAV